jgi:hypothetical protein
MERYGQVRVAVGPTTGPTMSRFGRGIGSERAIWLRLGVARGRIVDYPPKLNDV